MNKKKTFTITTPPGSIIICIALGLIYDWKVAFVTLVMFIILGTIWENWI